MNQLKQNYTVSVNLFLPSKTKHLKQKLKELESVVDITTVDVIHQDKVYKIPFNALLTKFNRLDIRSTSEDMLTVKGKQVTDSLRKWVGSILVEYRTSVIDLDKLILSSPKVVSLYESEDLDLTQLHSQIDKIKSTYQPSSLVRQIATTVDFNTDKYNELVDSITNNDVLVAISRISLVTIRHLLPTQPTETDLTKLYDIYNKMDSSDNELGNLRMQYLAEVQVINKQLKDVKFPTIGFSGRFFDMFVGEPLTGNKALFDLACLGIEVLLDIHKIIDVILLSRLLENLDDFDLSKLPRYEDKVFLTLADIVTKTSPLEIIDYMVMSDDVDNSFMQPLTREQWQFYHTLDCLKTLTRTITIEFSKIKQGAD